MFSFFCILSLCCKGKIVGDGRPLLLLFSGFLWTKKSPRCVHQPRLAASRPHVAHSRKSIKYGISLATAVDKTGIFFILSRLAFLFLSSQISLVEKRVLFRTSMETRSIQKMPWTVLIIVLKVI